VLRRPLPPLLAALACAVGLAVTGVLAKLVPVTAQDDAHTLEGFVALRGPRLDPVLSQIAHLADPLPYAVAALLLTLVALAAAAVVACNQIAYNAVDQAALLDVDYEAVPDVAAPPGFRVVRIAEGLTYPSSMAFDDAGVLYVLESHTIPIPGMKPEIYRVRGHDIEAIELAGEHAPSGEEAVGLTFHDG